METCGALLGSDNHASKKSTYNAYSIRLPNLHRSWLLDFLIEDVNGPSSEISASCPSRVVDARCDILRVVLPWSVGPDPVFPTPGVDSLKVLFLELEIIKVGLWARVNRDL